MRPSPTVAPLCGMRWRLAASLAQQLACEGEHEPRVVIEVARQQPTRLLGDPVGPLEAAGLHPGRRLRDAAGVEVECGAPGAHDRHLEPLADLGHPLLLLRNA